MMRPELKGFLLDLAGIGAVVLTIVLIAAGSFITIVMVIAAFARILSGG